MEDRYELNTNSPRFPLGMGMDRSAKRGAFGIDHFGIWACDLYVAVIKPRPSQPEPRFYLRRIVQAPAKMLPAATASVA